MDLAPEEIAAGYYTSLKGVSGIVATVTTMRDALALDLLGGADRLETTSFTLNGQTASGKLNYTREERLRILNAVLRMLAAGGRESTRKTIPSF